MPFTPLKADSAPTYMAPTTSPASLKESAFLSLESVASKIPRRKNQSVFSAIMQLTLAASTVLFLTGTLAHPGGLFDLVRLPAPKQQNDALVSDDLSVALLAPKIPVPVPGPLIVDTSPVAPPVVQYTPLVVFTVSTYVPPVVAPTPTPAPVAPPAADGMGAVVAPNYSAAPKGYVANDQAPTYNPTWKGKLDHFYDNSDEYIHPSRPSTYILPGFAGVMTELPIHSECVNAGPATMGAMKSIFVPRGYTCIFYPLPNCDASDFKFKLFAAVDDNLKDGSGGYFSSAQCHVNYQADENNRGAGTSA